MMHKALHPRDDRQRMCEEKKEKWGFASIEDSINESIRRLEDYNKKCK